ncbi:MAG: toxin-antitoxin system HicB family antitoxin [Candidatus Melainabacteria bacterium HGW-Melainabacteria-1]|nr:MAG: toxin-antitoxin system HicB family antitoxin [Candidatus Melainabacteria bacterium HGW-Melainabacteria-1]
MAKKVIAKPQADHYLFSVGWSAEDQAFIARVAEFPSLATHGDTQELALGELKQVLMTVLEDLMDSGEPIPVPLGDRTYSGRLNLRMSNYLHRQLAIEAAQQGVSLNQVINLKLASSL